MVIVVKSQDPGRRKSPATSFQTTTIDRLAEANAQEAESGNRENVHPAHADVLSNPHRYRRHVK